MTFEYKHAYAWVASGASPRLDADTSVVAPIFAAWADSEPGREACADGYTRAWDAFVTECAQAIATEQAERDLLAGFDA